MKKFYSILAGMLLGVAGFTAEAVNVTVSCSANSADAEHLVVKTGGADGEAVTMIPGEYYGCSATIDLTSDLYITTNSEIVQLSGVNYGSNYTSATVTDNVCVLSPDVLTEGCTVNVYLDVFKVISVLVKDGDSDKLTAKAGYYDEVTLADGVNKVKIKQYGSFTLGVKNKEEYKMTDMFSTVSGKHFGVSGFESASVYASEFVEDDMLSYTIIPASEFQAPSFKLRVDDPSLVQVQDVNYNPVTGLVANEWKKIEMDGTTTSLVVKAATYGDDLCSVRLNGEEQEGYYGTYSIYNITPDSEVDVKAVFPDEDYTLTVNVTPEDCDGVINSVKVDGAEIDWKAGALVHCGKKAVFELNQTLYILKSITINGVAKDLSSMYGDLTVKMTENTTVAIEAEKKPTYQVKVRANHPESVAMRLNYSLDIKLGEGDNIVEYTEDASMVSIDHTFGAVINTITFNYNDGTDPVVNTNGSYMGALTTNLESIDIDVTPLTRDKQYVFFFNAPVDGITSREIYPYEDYSRTNKIVFEQGYTVVNFGLGENPICFSYYPRNLHLGYLNGVEAEFQYSGWQLDMQDGDVLKVYDDITPATYAATFTAEEGAEYSLLKDRIVAVDDITAPVSDLENTEFTIIPTGATPQLDVYVKSTTEAAPAAEGDDAELGTKIEANADGQYIVKLTSDLTCHIAKSDLDGVENVTAGSEAADGAVFTITGVKVLDSAADLKTLPAGIYVANGKKVVVK